MKVEENMQHFEVMAGADLPEDLKVTVIRFVHHGPQGTLGAPVR